MYSGNEICFFLIVTLVLLFSNSQRLDSSLLNNLTQINPHPGNPGNVNGSFLCEELDKHAPFSSFTLSLTAIGAVEAEWFNNVCWVELAT
jgi:hypothetical protein